MYNLLYTKSTISQKLKAAQKKKTHEIKKIIFREIHIFPDNCASFLLIPRGASLPDNQGKFSQFGMTASLGERLPILHHMLM